ncbi:MAG TPA: single-stranded-DNA-specific exonuclease RecJ [bacterium]|nr:single-stranded-DNA-specific exonuclease RecJ [bacterium]
MAVANKTSWVVAPPDPEAEAFARAVGVPPIVGGILRRRGIVTVPAARDFLNPSLDGLSDPLTVPGMADATERLARALEAGEPLAVHGDYDVDGICATAILVRTLRGLGADPLWYVPHRTRDGYGLGVRAVEELAAQGARVLIAADCGITAVEAVARARALGLDVVVVDHHMPGSERPAAVIVAPDAHGGAADEGRTDAPCAAGLAFLLAWALRRRVAGRGAPVDLAALAALGTIADVVPLRGANRRLAAGGLAQLRAAPAEGLKALLEIAGITGPVEAWHVGWQLGPRLNAPGRLGDPTPALRLLLTDDPVEARALAQTLDEANRERQAVLEHVLAEALAQVGPEPDGAALVVAGEGWHPGVVGLVAGRLAEQYGRPAVAVALAGGTGRGSARSVEGFHLVEALGACRAHLRGFGGHAMAAGLSIDGAEIDGFRRAFLEVAAERAPARAAPLDVDAELALPDVTVALVTALDALAPFGPGNPQPVLAVRAVRAVTRRLVGDGAHLRMGVTDGSVFAETIGFSMAALGEVLSFTDASVDLAFVPELDRFEPGRVRLRLRALEVPGLDPATVLSDTGLLVDRLFRRADDYLDRPEDDRENAPEFYTKVAGVTFDDRQTVIATLVQGDPLSLRREPANPYDPHAVRVATADGRMVGYLSARVAGRIAPGMDAGGRYRATVSAVTGGGDRTLGVNLYVQREDGEPTAFGASSRRAWRALDRDAAIARLPIYVNGGRPLRPAQAEALAEIARGRSVVLAASPGRGWVTVIAGAAAVAAGGELGALVVEPLWCDAVRRGEQLAAQLGGLGLRVQPVHGLLGIGQRDRALAALRAGAADVVVASVEAAREGTLVAPWVDRATVTVLDGVSLADVATLPPTILRRTTLTIGEPTEAAALVRGRPGVPLLRDDPARPLVRFEDRRDAADPDAVVEEVVNVGEKTVVYTASPEGCVRLATRLRERAGADARIGYLHEGLPGRVRHVVARAFEEGRLRVLVTTMLHEEAVPHDLRRAVLASFPSGRRELLAACATVGLDRRPSTVTLAFGAGCREVRRRAIEIRSPGRDLLVRIYRALREWRGGDPIAWPDEETWARVRAAVPEAARATVGAACAVFEEVGLAVRESVGSGWSVRLVPADARRDLNVSLRFREGVRERAAFDAFAAWVERAAPAEIQRAARA